MKHNPHDKVLNQIKGEHYRGQSEKLHQARYAGEHVHMVDTSKRRLAKRLKDNK